MNMFAGTTLLVVTLGVLCGYVSSKFHTHSDNPAVNDFTNEFAKLIETNKEDANILNLVNMKPSEGGKIVFKGIYSFLKGKNPEAKSVLEQYKHFTENILGHIDSDQFARVLGFNFAHTLAKRDKRTKDNASQLAAEAVDDINTFVEKLNASSPEEQVLAIVLGYNKFLSRFGLNLSELAPEVINELEEEQI